MSLLKWLGLNRKTDGGNMQTGSGNQLLLGRMLANVIVVFDQTSNEFSIEVGGNEEYASKVQVKSAGQQTEISCPIPFLGPAPWGMSGSGKINGQLFVDGYLVDESKIIDILVHAPSNCTITADEIIGSVQCKNTTESLSVINNSMSTIKVGDVGGHLNLENDATQAVSVGSVSGSLSLLNKSAGQITIAKVDGSAVVHITGTGNVILQNGTIPHLKVITEGPGRFTHQGGVALADVESYGTGDINLQKTLGGDITCNMQSAGKVSILGGECGNITLEVGGTADFRFGGRIRGNISCTQTAPGKVYISEGDCPHLMLRIHGTGKFEFDGKVSHHVDAQLTAPGKATIASGNCKFVNATVTGTGDFTYMGHTEDSRLRTTGPGGIRVKSAKNPPDQKSTGTGKIKIG